MYDQMNLLDSPSAISLLESVVGALRSDLLDGQMIGRSGQALVRANLSARQAKELGLLTSGTFGRHSFTSSNSNALMLSLVNRLKQRLNTAGSTLFKMTWKESVTPSRRLVYLLRASGHRTSAQELGSWPTATKTDANRGEQYDPMAKNMTLNMAAQRVGWLTPRASESCENPIQSTARLQDRKEDTCTSLGAQAMFLATWPTPADFGQMQTGFPVETAKRGQLNPRLSGWLMGYPIAWDLCAFSVIPIVHMRNVSSTPRSSKKAKRGSEG